MDDVAVLDLNTMVPSYEAPHCDAVGPASSALFHPDGYSLWTLTAELDSGSVLRWDACHGDEALYVVEGSLEADGQRCGPGDAVVIEAGVEATVTAREPTSLLHCGPWDIEPPGHPDLGPASTEGRGIHVRRHDESPAGPPGGSVIVTYYADGTCKTCRLAVFEVVGDASGPHGSVSHVHSEDEIIHVLDGEVRIGRLLATSGMSVAVPAGRRYSFRTPGAFRFINYRRNPATVVLAPGTEPILETVDTLEQRSGH